MRWNLFLRDRMPRYVTEILALALAYVFLKAFRVQTQLMMALVIIFLIANVIEEVWEYQRKKKFYDVLEQAVRELDCKYLLPEMLSKPDFYEGRLVYEALADTNKSMYEHVAECERTTREFREYIELWVHEAKIPVAGLLLMCHNKANEDDALLAEICRVDDAIENVLYYSRSENAQKDYCIKSVALNRIFSNVAVKYRRMLQLAGASLEAEHLDHMILTDAKWMEYILGQLMSNSLKYQDSKRPLSIRVWAEASDDRICLCFRDNGIGIGQSDLPRIFDKTFTGANGRKGSKSTGMGLYIVKNLCSHLGHAISAESEEGAYTQIRITFAKNDYAMLQNCNVR